MLGLNKILGGAPRRRFGVSASQSIRYLAQTVYLTPLFLGGAAACLLAFAPQMQEVYLSLIEGADYARSIAGLCAVSLFSAFLYAWNHVEVSRCIDAIYPDHADLYFDRRVFDVRDLKSAFVASLAFFGLIIGLAQGYRHVLDAAGTGLPGGALRSLPELPHAIALAAAITLAIPIALLSLLYRFRKKTQNLKRFLVFCYALAGGLIAAPLAAPDAALSASKLLGPLAVTALVLLEFAVAVRLLFWILRNVFRIVLAIPSSFLLRTNWLPPSLRRITAALVPLLAVAAMAASIINDGRSSDESREEAAADGAAAEDLGAIFRSWLAERKTGPGRYPVFVVAAQGGGIYAASTTAAFLATLQDHCPAFARHVFAISAVSGGSVGASLFNAAFADSIARGTNRKAAVDVEPGCDSFFAEPGELSKRLRAINENDHISPLLANLAPDFVRGVLPREVRREEGEPEGKPSCTGASSTRGGRERALEKSFADSFMRSGPSGGEAGDACSSLLVRPFSEGWSVKGDLPALILNATWVETGYRVAFAPFALHPFGAGTLFGFNGLPHPPASPTLIQAAIVSARFPAILPPWTIEAGSGSRLTFVDGGYADSSGVSTALQLYNKLKQAGGDDADFYLIALTDKSRALISAANVEPAGTMPIRSWFYDAVSPLTTLLSMRDLQSRKAVTEARTELGDRMIVIQLDQKAFPLPLGWTLSRLSNDIIRLTIGDPERCTLSDDRADTALSISNRNSCGLKRIVELISPKAVPSRSLFELPAAASSKPMAEPAAVARAKPAVANQKSGAASPKQPQPKALNAWTSSPQ